MLKAESLEKKADTLTVKAIIVFRVFSHVEKRSFQEDTL